MANLNLRVVEKVFETSDACTFYFENTAGNTLFYKPGQFLTLVLQINGKEYRRSYSLATVPVRDKYPGITIKRVEKGLISNYLIDNVRIGDVIEFLHPMGVFYPELALKNKKEYFLFAAGSGITPLFSILQSILLKEPSSTVNLIYSNRDELSIVFKSKLDELELQFIDRLKIVHVLSRPSENWMGFKERLNELLIQDLILELNQIEKTNVSFFLCGPTGYMKICQEAIGKIGFALETIKKEDFGASVLLGVEEAEETQEKVVKLIYNGTEHEFLLPAGKSILDGALENGIKIPYSCTSGVCTACLGTCLEGEVDISRSDTLSENEKKQGYILTCIGRPITNKVVINID